MQPTHQYDLYYELRPYLCGFFGVYGLFQNPAELATLSHACSIALFSLSLLIIYWRWAYRRVRS